MGQGEISCSSTRPSSRRCTWDAAPFILGNGKRSEFVQPGKQRLAADRNAFQHLEGAHMEDGVRISTSPRSERTKCNDFLIEREV